MSFAKDGCHDARRLRRERLAIPDRNSEHSMIGKVNFA